MAHSAGQEQPSPSSLPLKLRDVGMFRKSNRAGFCRSVPLSGSPQADCGCSGVAASLASARNALRIRRAEMSLAPLNVRNTLGEHFQNGNVPDA